MQTISRENTIRKEKLSFLWTAEAAELGIAAGTMWPKVLQAAEDFGNGQNFILEDYTPSQAMYRQAFGMISLLIFND